MFYLLITDRIVTERDLYVAYEICCGSIPGIHPGHYEEWLEKNHGVIRKIPEDSVTVEQLVRGKCLSAAVKKYSMIHKCSILDSKKAIYAMLHSKK